MLERLLRWFERRREQRRLLRELDEAPLGPFPLETKGEATNTFETVKNMVDRATEEKRKARNTVQRILSLLTGDE